MPTTTAGCVSVSKDLKRKFDDVAKVNNSIDGSDNQSKKKK
jgi:hypothetical protein